jgi:hypothetical protein
VTDLPEGVALQISLYGKPNTDTMQTQEAVGVQPAPPGGVPYDESLTESSVSQSPKKRRVTDEPG